MKLFRPSVQMKKRKKSWLGVSEWSSVSIKDVHFLLVSFYKSLFDFVVHEFALPCKGLNQSAIQGNNTFSACYLAYWIWIPLIDKSCCTQRLLTYLADFSISFRLLSWFKE